MTWQILNINVLSEDEWRIIEKSKLQRTEDYNYIQNKN
jgi:ferredoxin-fold anticodon binding domain-containing protein